MIKLVILRKKQNRKAPSHLAIGLHHRQNEVTIQGAAL